MQESRRRIGTGLLVFLILTSLTVLSTSAQERELTVREKVQASELILEGTVSSRVSAWNEDHSRIYTNVTIVVKEYLKGATTEKSVVVRHLGGEVGEVGEIYSEIARFEDEEEVLVFLRRDNPDAPYRLIGGAQGKYQITLDEDTREQMVAKNRTLTDLKQEILRIVRL